MLRFHQFYCWSYGNFIEQEQETVEQNLGVTCIILIPTLTFLLQYAIYSSYSVVWPKI